MRSVPPSSPKSQPPAHRIGLEEVDTGISNIHYNTVLLAKLDERDYIIRR